jgi:hypothetical protein
MLKHGRLLKGTGEQKSKIAFSLFLFQADSHQARLRKRLFNVSALSLSDSKPSGLIPTVCVLIGWNGFSAGWFNDHLLTGVLRTVR